MQGFSPLLTHVQMFLTSTHEFENVWRGFHIAAYPGESDKGSISKLILQGEPAEAGPQPPDTI